jgi:hypothetical protein
MNQKDDSSSSGEQSDEEEKGQLTKTEVRRPTSDQIGGSTEEGTSQFN